MYSLKMVLCKSAVLSSGPSWTTVLHVLAVSLLHHTTDSHLIELPSQNVIKFSRSQLMTFISVRSEEAGKYLDSGPQGQRRPLT